MANTRYRRVRFGAMRYAERGPGTQQEYLDQPYWLRGVGGAFEAGTDSSASGSVELPANVGDEPSTLTIDAESVALYTIEVYDSGGSKLRTVSDWWDGTLKQEVDQASELMFTIAGTDAAVADLAPSNIVWLRDRWGLVIETFRLARTIKRRDGDAIFFDVVCIGRIAQLGREPVLDYSVPLDANEDPVATSVANIVAGLLENQEQSPEILLGDIDPVIGNYELTFAVADTNVLDALRELQRLLPKALAGHFYLTGAGKLNWNVQIGTTGHTLEVGKQLRGVHYEIDWEELITRIYLYGQGQDPRTRVKLTDPGADLANEYLDGSTTGTYGIVPFIKVDRRVKYPASLLKMAQRILEETEEPAVELDVDVLDLAKADTDMDEAFADLAIGSEYTVTDSDQGISTTVKVKAITWRLDDPLPARVELVNRRRSLADILRSIWQQIGEPLNVNDDGTRYPNISRQYTGAEDIDGLEYRNGDWRYNNGAMEFWDDGAWTAVGGGDFVTWGGEVTSLPTLPTDKAQVVYWKSADGGTGDDQLWVGVNLSGVADKWSPLGKASTKDGGSGT